MRENANLSVDLKKGRLRIHKAVLHSLGDPKYIQLLVNPEAMAVAVLRVDAPRSGDPVHKIPKERLHSENSYEIYSQFFCVKLLELVPSLDVSGLFRISGEVFASKGMAVFDLRTLHRINS